MLSSKVIPYMQKNFAYALRQDVKDEKATKLAIDNIVLHSLESTIIMISFGVVSDPSLQATSTSLCLMVNAYKEPS